MSSETPDLEWVKASYDAAVAKNKRAFAKGDVYATENYVFPNQKIDALQILNHFQSNPEVRAVSCIKRTKVGADGLMIELMYQFCTHPDDKLRVLPENIRLITGMSNKMWEEQMKDKVPECFKDVIFHHGKLGRSDMKELADGLIIIDEIDTGDKVGQKMHNILKQSGVWNYRNIKDRNIYIVAISATPRTQIEALKKWDNHHITHMMTIPTSYVGHDYFLENGIIQEYYPLDTREACERWVREDILERYGQDYRIHFVRTVQGNYDIMREVCDRNQINFEEHTSEKSSTRNILTRDELKEIFDRDFNQHCVIAVKEYFRRADLIPNQWKLKIGAMHERCADKTKDGTQVQGFTGRMTGYWKYILENGHITGPYRTSREAIENYETFYSNPEEPIPEGDCKKTMYHPQNVDGIQYIDYDLNPTQFIWSGKVEGISRGTFEEFATVQELNQRKKELNPKAKVCKIEGATLNESGYVLWTLSNKKQIIYRKDIQKLKKPSSHMPSGKSKMVERNGTPKNTFPIGKIDMREYVFYNDENCDPTQYKFALRWVKRIA